MPGPALPVERQLPGPRRHIALPKLIHETDGGLEQKPQQGHVALDALVAPGGLPLLRFHQRRIRIQRVRLRAHRAAGTAPCSASRTRPRPTNPLARPRIPHAPQPIAQRIGIGEGLPAQQPH